ncbi:hypothetical protein B9Z55_013183 [Caenorhabditis nigoni]|uniref:Uncharacterized protein n=1 Tax=Caenorhabditis nigoni TaxID=1611254 RepID=A0A2G5U0H2_9PELO|nr:hypothetical protein B9Z55_013183 [Caenorhabditis nigoni]
MDMLKDRHTLTRSRASSDTLDSFIKIQTLSPVAYMMRWTFRITIMRTSEFTTSNWTTNQEALSYDTGMTGGLTIRVDEAADGREAVDRGNGEEKEEALKNGIYVRVILDKERLMSSKRLMYDPVAWY